MHYSAKLDYLVIRGNSIYLWSVGGRSCCHSRDDGRCVGNSTVRSLIILSHIMKISIIIATTEIIEPNEETTFHVVYASG